MNPRDHFIQHEGLPIHQVPFTDLHLLQQYGADEWNLKENLPDIVTIAHRFDSMHIAENVVSLFLFLKHYNAVQLEDFLREFDECKKEGDFYDFGKYCIKLYRGVYEKQLIEATNPSQKKESRQRIKRIDKFVLLHNDPKDNFWKTNAIVVAPMQEEEPLVYKAYLAFNDGFMGLMKKLTAIDPPKKGRASFKVDTDRSAVAHAIHDVL